MKKVKTKHIVIALLTIIVILVILKRTHVLGGDNGIEVSVDVVKKRDISETVTATGKAYPVDEVKVSSDVSGEIIDLYVEEGDYVQQGQVLARIESSIYQSAVERADAMVSQSKSNVSATQSQVAQAQATLANAKAQYDRYQKLLNDKVVSQSEFDNIKSNYLSAKANVEALNDNVKSGKYAVSSANSSLKEANENLRRTIIRAPRSGIISALNVEKGERVVGTATMSGTEMMRISNMDRMEVKVEVGENDIVKIKLSDTATVILEAFPNHTLRGKVSRISNNISTGVALTDDQAASYLVYIEIDPISYRSLSISGNIYAIRPGMSARTQIYTRKHIGVIAVPYNSVTTRLDTSAVDEISKECVFILDSTGKKVSMVYVSTDLQDDNYIEITKGLRGGEKVVDAPYTAISKLLESGKAVKVVDKAELYKEEDK